MSEAAITEPSAQGDQPPALCRDCGYDLRGLPTDGRCPECGASVHASLISTRLTDASPAWLRTIAGGMLAVRIGILLVIPGAFLITLRWPAAVLLCLAAALRCIGVWRATQPDPRYTWARRWRVGASAFRVLAGGDLLAHVGLAVAGWPNVSHETLVLLLMVAVPISIIVYAFLLCDICQRLFGSLVRRTSALLAWWLMATYPLHYLLVGLANSQPFGSGWELVFLMLAFGLGSAFFGGTLLLLFDIGWLRRELKRAIRTARQPEATD